ncbi:MAG: TonB-dependent receptor [Flavobacteriales bacterium]|nr:TonB-dependent receptor [Flavobacteriales bacterium]
MKSLLFFVLLLFLSVRFSYAQNNCNYQLSGYIIDEHDASALAFSTISLVGENRGVVADIEGYFILTELCAKKYKIAISHIGCEPDTVEIQIKKSVMKNFFLEHHAEALEEVKITGNSDPKNFQQTKVSEAVLSENTGKSIGEILSAINGVNTFKTGANISKPVINGFKNNRVQFINQGIQLQSQQWGDEHAPEIDPFAAANYTVIKGSGSVKYAGGALGGLVLIEPKPLLRSPGLKGEFNSIFATNNRLYNNSLMLEGNSKFFPRFAWRIQGSFKRSGNIKTPSYYQKNTGLSELNGSADMGYYGEKWNVRFFYSLFNSEVGIFSGAHIGNLTDLQLAIDRKEPRTEDQEGFSYEIRRPKQIIIHELAKMEFNYYPTELGKINFKFARQFNIREEFDKELPRNPDLAALNIPEFSLGLESFSSNLNWTLPDVKQWKTEIGVAFIEQTNSINSFTDFIPDYKQNIYSAFLLEQWQKENFGVSMGLRLDRNELQTNKLIKREYINFQNDFNSLTINLGFNYSWAEKSTLKTNITYTERPPAINELYSSGLHHGSASIEFGNSNIGKEKSSSFDFTYLFKNKKWEYELYTYVRLIRDFIYLNPIGLELTIRGAYPSYEWTNTDALINGFDQTIHYYVTEKLSISNAASFLWGRNIMSENYLINMPANRIETSFDYLLTLPKKNKSYSTKIGNQYVFMQNRYNPEQEFAIPPDSYHLFFAGLGIKTKVKEKQNIELSVRAENIFNKAYRDYLNRFRFFADEQGRNFTIRLKYNF